MSHKEIKLRRVRGKTSESLVIKTSEGITILGSIERVCLSPPEWCVIVAGSNIVDLKKRYDTADEAFDVLFELSKNYIRSAL